MCFCPHCNATLPEDSLFCPDCGMSLKEPDTPSIPESPVPQKDASSTRSPNIKTPVTFRLVALVVCCACIVVLLIGVLLWNNNRALTPEDIYALVAPATVEIQVERIDGTATGTGFFFGSEGWIVTNYHVIENGWSGHVVLSNGEKYDIITVIGCDADRDIAIIDIEYAPESVLNKRETSVVTGETVYALGSSLGLTGSFSEGIISSAEREFDGAVYLQTTAPISQGNSGGPLVDARGNVIGITTAGFTDGQNLNLAIPITYVENVNTDSPASFGFKSSPNQKFVAVAAEEWPFLYKENGVYKGIYVDLVNEINDENWDISFVTVDQETAIRGVYEYRYLVAFGFEKRIVDGTLVASVEYHRGATVLHGCRTYEEWSIIRPILRDMIEDGRMEKLFASYGIEWERPSELFFED